MSLLRSTEGLPGGFVDRFVDEDVGAVILPDVVDIVAYADQRKAAEALPDYDVCVVHRRPAREKVTTLVGTIWHERVLYSDGAVKEVTIAEPHPNLFGSDGVSPYIVVSGDPLHTGPHGLNEIDIHNLVASGFTVIWSHHESRGPANRLLAAKDIGISAYQDHALLEDLEKKSGLYTKEVIRAGYSRNAAVAEAFIALASRHGRQVLASDLSAECFSEQMSGANLVETLIRQAPAEALCLLKLLGKTVLADINQGTANVLKLLNTFDLHPKNVIHEATWLLPLIQGDCGLYARAVPLDAVGTRTYFNQDAISQPEVVAKIHASRPDMAILKLPGAHRAYYYPENLRLQAARYKRLLAYMHTNNMSLTSITVQDILPEAA